MIYRSSRRRLKVHPRMWLAQLGVLAAITFVVPSPAAGLAPDSGSYPLAETGTDTSELVGLESGIPHGFRALLFTRTAGFRHDSIPAGIAAIQALAVEHDFEVDATEDASVFTASNLAGYDVVIFLNTTGNVLGPTAEDAMEEYIRSGGGFVGIHAAADTEYDWSWYGNLVGAWFQSHPSIQSATVRVVDRDHPSTTALPKVWVRTDEWYDYQSNPRGTAHVLASLDTDSYSGDTMGHDHPIAWCRPFDGGRSWYTGMGHTAASYSEDGFLEHILGGIEWAAGAQEGDCSATIGVKFEKEVLDGDVDSPMDLAVAPDGAVFFVEIEGRVRRYDPVTRETTTVAEIPVQQVHEDGLLGIVLDPAFESNRWIYLFYSPAGTEEKQHLSRFEWNGTSIDLTTEIVMLEVSTQRTECCHSGGSMAFDPSGNLFLSMGDNTNPFASDGFAPIDERSGRSAWDAQRSSGNTADLRGKIIRIHPEQDGSYTIPEGNLFSGGTDGRAEIYAMGLRNPFRISLDPLRGWLYWGDVGPDGRSASSQRGPLGYDEWNQAREAGNFGWPYCIADNQPYRDYDFNSGAAGAWFDCAALANESVNNTGATNLPPARSAWIWYPYGSSPDFPGIPSGNGRTAMAGPVYQFSEGREGDEGLPAYFHDRLLIYEWSRNFIAVVTLDDDGAPLSIDPFPGDPDLNQPIAIKQAPDGSLYLLEWGTGFGTGNPDAALSRISFAGGGRKPVAIIDADADSGHAPLTVNFSASRSFDPDGDTLSFEWDLDGHGTVDASGPTASWTYEENGAYVVRLTATDAFGNFSTATHTITLGNSVPVITVDTPATGGFFEWGDRIPYSLLVEDAEDGSSADGGVDCSDVEARLFIGHDSHTHPLTTTAGCEGEIELSDGHGDDADRIFTVIEFHYQDRGADGVPSVTAVEEIVLLPRKLQAEHYDAHSGVELEDAGDTLGGRINLAYIDHGDWVRFDNLNLTGVDFVTFRVASAGPGGRIEMRRGATNGDLVGTARVTPTGDWQVYRDVTIPVADTSDPSGPMYLVFLNTPGSSGLFNVNYLVAHGRGVSSRTPGETGLTGVYSGNEGTLGRVDPQLSFDWGGGGPDGVGAAFEATWAGTFQPPRFIGSFFTLTVQGSADVFLDGERVLSITSSLAETSFRSSRLTFPGSSPVPILVNYRSGTDQSRLWLQIEASGVPFQSLGAPFLTPAGLTAAESAEGVPTEFGIRDIYPNPSPGVVSLELSVSMPGMLQLEIFDLLGRRVSTVSRVASVGSQTQVLGIQSLSPGVYHVVLTGPGGQRATRAIVRL